MKRKLALVILLILASPNLTYAETVNDYLTKEELKRILTESYNNFPTNEEVIELISKNDEDSLTEKELRDQIIEMHKERIGILEGNISSLLALFAALLALITFAGLVFGWWVRNQITSKVEETRRIKEEVSENKASLSVKLSEVSGLWDELRRTTRTMEETIHQHNQSKHDYEEAIFRINGFEKYLDFHDLQFEKFNLILKFFSEKPIVRKTVERFDYYSNQDLYGDEFIRYWIIKKIGSHYTKEGESLRDIYNYLFKILFEEEKKFLSYACETSNYDDIDEDPDINDVESTYDDWHSIYTDMKTILSIIESHILMNPDKYPGIDLDKIDPENKA